MKTIDTLGGEFVKKHRWLLDMARYCEVAICGGCAAAIVKENTEYVPGDLDLVTTKGNALRLIDNINHFLLDHKVHYRIGVNSLNDFVPPSALAHFRIMCPFWLPVCVFVLPDDKFKYYRIKGSHLLQYAEHVKEAADEMTLIDGRFRMAGEPEDNRYKPQDEDIPF
jgi:hypothetical protein